MTIPGNRVVAQLNLQRIKLSHFTCCLQDDRNRDLTQESLTPDLWVTYEEPSCTPGGEQRASAHVHLYLQPLSLIGNTSCTLSLIISFTQTAGFHRQELYCKVHAQGIQVQSPSNHAKTIPHPNQTHWENYLLWNSLLMPKNSGEIHLTAFSAIISIPSHIVYTLL